MNIEDRIAYNKKYKEANKDKLREYSKKYREANKEKLREKRKKYRDANIDKCRESNKKYYELNKDKKKEYDKSPKGKKSKTIHDWKRRGVLGNLSAIYDERYLPSTNCEVCNKIYKSTFDRCLDHDHDTGLFRQVLCRVCNNYDHWMKIITKN